MKLVYKDDENNSYDLELSINENGSVELINSLPKDTKIIKPQLTLDKITEEFKSKFSSNKISTGGSEKTVPSASL